MPANNKIRSAYGTLPSAERKVADFILDDPERAMRMVINEIAEAAGVSVPSVTRLARRLGYKGFLDFRVALANGAAANGATQKLSPITDEDSDSTVIDKLCGYSIMSLEDTYHALDKEAFCRAAHELAEKNRVFVCGESATLANDIARSFNLLGMEAITLCDELSMKIYRSRFTKGDAVIAFCHSGRNKEIQEEIAAAKEAGAETMYLSSYAGNQAANTCDYFFSASHIGFTKLPFRIENSSSVVTLCNLLITLVARFRGNSIEGGRRKRK